MRKSTIRLIVKNGVLFMPHGGWDHRYEEAGERASIILYRTPAATFEAIGFPLADSPATVSSQIKLALALRDELQCNPYMGPSDVIRLPDGSVFDFEAVLAANSRACGTWALKPGVETVDGVPPLLPNISLDPTSSDAVIRELCRLWSLAKADANLTLADKTRLRMRLLIELNAYEVWQRRHASLVGQPLRWVPPEPPVSEETLPRADMYLALPVDSRPSIHAFAGPSGFTRRILHPRIDGVPLGLRPDLVPESVKPFLTSWRTQYRQVTWSGPDDNDVCTLWAALDIGGMSIARAIKRYVGDAAQVIYSKPHMDPFFDYESFREIGPSGQAIVLDRR
jgi:hypothetical protein